MIRCHECLSSTRVCVCVCVCAMTRTMPRSEDADRMEPAAGYTRTESGGLRESLPMLWLEHDGASGHDGRVTYVTPMRGLAKQYGDEIHAYLTTRCAHG